MNTNTEIERLWTPADFGHWRHQHRDNVYKDIKKGIINHEAYRVINKRTILFFPNECERLIKENRLYVVSA